jgi:hypothetical protein
MKCLVLESWLLLAYFDLVMRFRGFPAVHDAVRNQGVHAALGVDQAPVKCLCHAVDLACVFYFKRALCLQRSAATVVLLRRHAWNAELVIGAQLLPFRSHAWVTVENEIVNDKPYLLDIYQVLERC